ncbi:MAG: tail fiber domain-containing protein [Salinivirgaceae bacterium]|nr:tail fiber domain-containing protein [Salinivirgaceae bacterium]
MNIKNLFLTVAATLTTMAAVAQTEGFSYQAVIRNSNGELVNNKNVNLRITLTDQKGEQVMYQETQTAPTNNYGVLSVIVGNGTPDGSQALKDVDWASGSVWMRVEVDPNGGSSYVDLGLTQLQAVPYAFYAANGGKGEKGDKGDPGRDGMQVEGQLGQTLVHNGTTWVATDEISFKKLDVKAGNATEDALFEVKDKDGNVVFAVYPNGVHVYIDTTDHNDKARRSGFIVTGRTASKGDPDSYRNDFLAIDGEGTKVFVDDDESKARRSGFLVTGRTASKGDGKADLFTVNGEGTKVYIDNQLDNSKTRRSGFIVTGRTATKDDDATNYLEVATDGTQVHFDDDAAKTRRSGFVVTGRTATKDGAAQEFMTINTDSTRFYINGGNGSKGDFGVAGRSDGAKDSGNGGFAVSGRDGAKDGVSNNLFNIDLSTNAQTLDSVNRVYWYPEKNAFMAGNLKVESPDSVGENSFNAGFQNKAIGKYSQALGYKSVAKGDYTTAIGRGARADSDNAYALGNNAKATKMNAFALGMNSTADGEGSYAFGEDAIASGTGSFAFGRSSVIKDTIYRQYNIIERIDETNYAAPKATGNYSYSIGTGTVANAEGSFAMGIDNKATGKNAVAFGKNNNATGVNAIAFGKSNNGHALNAIAIGIDNKISPNAEQGTTIGYGNTVTKANAYTMGFNCEANATFATAIGRCAHANATYGVALGNFVTAKSVYEVVVGTWNTDYEPSLWGSVNYPSGEDRAFTVANGYESWAGTCTVHKSDALVIYKNGNAEFRGNVYPSDSTNIYTNANTYSLGTSTKMWDKVYAKNGVQTSSDQRLKTNIKPLERALDKVLTLNGVTYEWRVKEFPNKHLDDKTHVGVIAQEVEAVLPEAVETGEDGYKSVNYSNITPLLIEAIKEQQTIIDNQQKEIDELKAQMKEILEKVK